MAKNLFSIGSVGESIDDILLAPACVEECKEFDGAILSIFDWSLNHLGSHTKHGQYKNNQLLAFQHLDKPFTLVVSAEDRENLRFIRYKRESVSLFVKGILPSEVKNSLAIDDVFLSVADGRTLKTTSRYYLHNRSGVFAPSSFFTNHNTCTFHKDHLMNFMTMSLVRRTNWTVKIGHPGMFRFGLVTDAIGVQSFLSDRDKTTSRRAAIAHWVEHHWRQNRKDPNVENRVRAHFRGKNSCEWRDLSIEVSPPAELIERESHEKTLPIEDRTRVRPLQIC